MRDLNHAMTLIEATVAASRVPVTLKMRLGWDETTMNASELARRAEEAGIRMITVHGRTRCQFYKGRANWPAIAAVKRSLNHIPLVANGDVETIADVRNILDASLADGVMVGRGAYGRPWLLAQVAQFLRTGMHLPDPPLDEQRRILRGHYRAMLAHHGERTGVRLARKHVAWYSKGLPGSAEFRAAVNRAETATEVEAMIDAFYLPLIEAGARAERLAA